MWQRRSRAPRPRSCRRPTISRLTASVQPDDCSVASRSWYVSQVRWSPPQTARNAPARPAAAGAVNPARLISHVPAATSTAPGACIGQDPPHRGLRRRRRGSGTADQVHLGQDCWRHVSDPASDRGAALHPGHDRRRGQRQHGRSRMILPDPTRPSDTPANNSGRSRHKSRDRHRHDRPCRCGHGSTTDRLTHGELRSLGSVRGPYSYRSFVTFPRRRAARSHRNTRYKS